MFSSVALRLGMGKGDQEGDGESFYGDLESPFRVT